MKSKCKLDVVYVTSSSLNTCGWVTGITFSCLEAFRMCNAISYILLPLFVACQELVHHLFSRFLSVHTFLYIPFCLTCSALPFISPDIGYPLFLDVVCTIKLTFSCVILQPHTIRSSPVFVTRYFKLCAWMESKSQGSYPTSATDKRCCPLIEWKRILIWEVR